MRRALAMSIWGAMIFLGRPALGEEITKDTTWPTGEVREVPEDLLVAFGVVLTIEPGVAVRMGAGISITVAGTLVARGTEEAPIRFLPAGDDADAPRWGSLIFEDGATDAVFAGVDGYVSGSILEFCELRSGTRAVRLTGASPYVHRCLFTDNRTAPAFTPPGGGAILVEGGSVARIRSCNFQDNEAELVAWGGAIYVDTSDPILQDNVFTGNRAVYGGALATDRMASPIVGNVFTGNEAHESKGGGASLVSTVSAFLNNTLTGNHARQDGGGVHVCVDCDPHAAPAFFDNEIAENTSEDPDPHHGAAGLGAAFLRAFLDNGIHGNLRLGDPSNFGWFHDPAVVGSYPDWVRNPSIAGNWWGTDDPSAAGIFDGSGAADFGVVEVTPVLDAAPGPAKPRVVISTRRLRYATPDEAIPVFLTLYNPGAAREVELLILRERGGTPPVPWRGDTGFPGVVIEGGRHRLTLPENAVFFRVIAEVPRPAEPTEAYGVWHAALFDAATGERIGAVMTTRFDLDGEVH
ncbi:MAG: right-handed parallel beta-helix repeat-containing protein [Pseudomonadota bacterium]